uniref:Uncharacterized protein n=1 Tax=Marmota marmota marmota TaxID=9994 RepID=A0A8C5YM29_MARMA
MYDIIRENKRHEKDVRIQQLLENSTSEEDGSNSSSSECKGNLPSHVRVQTQTDKDWTCSAVSFQQFNPVAKEQRCATGTLQGHKIQP